jgi:hypothetical protein
MALSKPRPDPHTNARRLPRGHSLAATSATSAGDDDDPSTQLAEALDRSVHYLLSRAIAGGMSAAYFDWWSSPGKQLQLWQKGFRKGIRLTVHLYRCAADPALAGPPCISPLAQDQRFRDEAWQQWPFNGRALVFRLLASECMGSKARGKQPGQAVAGSLGLPREASATAGARKFKRRRYRALRLN